jgi:hypothetical protein
MSMETEPTAPEPDDKDWTWVLERPCPQCGFDPAALEVQDLPQRIVEALGPWPAVLAGPDATRRPEPGVWSPLEYACHVRDVLHLFTERSRLMLERDDPTFANWDQDAAAQQERYWEQDPGQVLAEIQVAGEAAAAAFGRVAPDQWSRRGTRSNGSTFTVASLGRYFVHDLAHHAWDVRQPA